MLCTLARNSTLPVRITFRMFQDRISHSENSFSLLSEESIMLVIAQVQHVDFWSGLCISQSIDSRKSKSFSQEELGEKTFCD